MLTHSMGEPGTLPPCNKIQLSSSRRQRSEAQKKNALLHLKRKQTSACTCLLMEVSLTGETSKDDSGSAVRRKKSQEVIGRLPRDRAGSVAGGMEPCCRNPSDKSKGKRTSYI